MSNTEIWRTFVVLLAFMIVPSCMSGRENPIESSKSNNQPIALPDISRVSKAKDLIDDHLRKTIPLIEKIESVRNLKGNLKDIRQGIMAELEPLAIEEAELYLSMTPAERLETYEYLVTHLGKPGSDPHLLSNLNTLRGRGNVRNQSLKDRLLNAFDSLGIEVNRLDHGAESFRDSTGIDGSPVGLLQVQGPRRANCIG